MRARCLKVVCGAWLLVAGSAFAEGWGRADDPWRGEPRLQEQQLIKIGDVPAEDVRRIQTMVRQIDESIEARDVDSFVQQFAPNATLVAPTGEMVLGRHNIRQMLREEFERDHHDEMRSNVQSIRMLRRDLALVDVVAAGADPREHGMHVTMVLTKRDRRWQILDARVFPTFPAEPAVGGGGFEHE